MLRIKLIGYLGCLYSLDGWKLSIIEHLLFEYVYQSKSNSFAITTLAKKMYILFRKTQIFL